MPGTSAGSTASSRSRARTALRLQCARVRRVPRLALAAGGAELPARIRLVEEERAAVCGRDETRALGHRDPVDGAIGLDVGGNFDNALVTWLLALLLDAALRVSAQQRARPLAVLLPAAGGAELPARIRLVEEERAAVCGRDETRALGHRDPVDGAIGLDVGGNFDNALVTWLLALLLDAALRVSAQQRARPLAVLLP